MRVSFANYDAIPASLRRFQESPRMMFAAAALSHGQKIVSVLDCWDRESDDLISGYVLTDKLLIWIVGNDDPVAETWKLADIEHVRLSKFDAQREFAGEQVVGFDVLEVRFAGASEPVSVPAHDGASSRDRQEFLGALWSARLAAE